MSKPMKEEMLNLLETMKLIVSAVMKWERGRDNESTFQNIRSLIEKSDKGLEVDFDSLFYKNCKRQRKKGAKICQVCPFRKGIEREEAGVRVKEGK